MLSTVPTIQHTQKTWVLGEARLLFQQKVHYLQVNINKPLMLIITYFLQHILHRFILLLQCNQMSNGYRGKLVAVVLQNTFQWSLAAVNEQSPIFGFVLWHSKLEQKLHNICTVHQVLHCREKTEEADASTVREEVFSFNLDANSSAESFDKLRSQTRSFNSFYENGCWASSSRTASSSSSCPWTLEASSSLMSGSSPKIGTTISSQWATGRRDDWRSGDLRLPRFFL